MSNYSISDLEVRFHIFDPETCIFSVINRYCKYQIEQTLRLLIVFNKWAWSHQFVSDTKFHLNGDTSMNSEFTFLTGAGNWKLSSLPHSDKENSCVSLKSNFQCSFFSITYSTIIIWGTRHKPSLTSHQWRNQQPGEVTSFYYCDFSKSKIYYRYFLCVWG